MSSPQPTEPDAAAPGSGAAGSAPSAAGEPLLGAGCAFEGLLCFEGEVRIAGKLRGEVVATGRLVLEAGADLDADVVVDELVVAGTLTGRAVARRRAELLATARVEGLLAAPVLRIEAGAEIRGPCHTGDDARRIAAEADAAGALDTSLLGGSGKGRGAG